MSHWPRVFAMFRRVSWLEHFEPDVPCTWFLRVLHMILVVAWLLRDWQHYHTRRRCPKSPTPQFAGRMDKSRSEYSFHRKAWAGRRLGLGMFAVSASMSQVLPWPPMCMSPSCKPFLCTSFCFLHVMCHSTAWVHHRWGNGNLRPSFHFHAISTASLVTSCMPIAAFAEMLLFLGGVVPAAAGIVQVIQRPPATKAWRHCAYEKDMELPGSCVCL